NAWAMESQVGPVPTFSPSACQLDGASLVMLGLWKSWPAAAMVCDQAREIRSRSPWMERGAAPAALRAALMAERKQDSSTAGEAEAGTSPCSASAPTVPAIIRLRTALGCCKRTSFGGLAASARGQEVHDFASPGHPGFAFVVRPWLRAFVVLHPVHRQCAPGPAWPGNIKNDGRRRRLIGGFGGSYLEKMRRGG